jgi:hypothetical protein
VHKDLMSMTASPKEMQDRSKGLGAAVKVAVSMSIRNLLSKTSLHPGVLFS